MNREKTTTKNSSDNLKCCLRLHSTIACIFYKLMLIPVQCEEMHRRIQLNCNEIICDVLIVGVVFSFVYFSHSSAKSRSDVLNSC